MTYANVIAFRLNSICEEKGITLNMMATICGVRQSTLNNIVNGKTRSPELRTLHRIAVGLNMTVCQLLDFPEMNETIFEDE